MSIPLSKIKDNPFRPDGLPFNEGKVAALMQSIEVTEFWDNVVVRQDNGTYELAYGHHRLEALRRLAKQKSINPIVRDWDDGQMARVFVAENSEDYGNDASVAMQGISAIVAAIPDIEDFPKPAPRTPGPKLRAAPSYARTSEPQFGSEDHLYTAQSLHQYLQVWSERWIQKILVNLETEEAGIGTRRDFQGLATGSVYEVSKKALTTFRSGKEARAKDEFHVAIGKLRKSGLRTAAQMPTGLAPTRAPDFNEWADKFGRMLCKQFTPADKASGEKGGRVGNNIAILLRLRHKLEYGEREYLCSVFGGLSKYLSDVAKRLENGRSKEVPQGATALAELGSATWE